MISQPLLCIHIPIFSLPMSSHSISSSIPRHAVCPGGYSPENGLRVRAALKTPFSRPPDRSLRPPFQNFPVPQDPIFSWNHKFSENLHFQVSKSGKISVQAAHSYQNESWVPPPPRLYAVLSLWSNLQHFLIMKLLDFFNSSNLATLTSTVPGPVQTGNLNISHLMPNWIVTFL